MATGRTSSSGSQDRDEKKDHPRRGGGHRGMDDNEQFDDPEAERALGHRTYHSQPGRKGGQPSSAAGAPVSDNTEPGGNRPTRSHRGQDHNWREPGPAQPVLRSATSSRLGR